MKEITETYVSYETAKLLKEKGFECCLLYVYTLNENGEYCLERLYDDEFFEEKTMIFAPTQQMVLKWIREQGFYINVDIDVDYDEDERGTKWYHEPAWDWVVFRIDERKQMSDDGALYATYEQAAEVAIKWCLKNLI